MKNKKIVLATAFTIVALIWWVASASNLTSTWNTNSPKMTMNWDCKMWGMHNFGSWKTLDQTWMLLRENVIDKLLSWTTLTTEEEVIRQDIIKERATKKTEMEKRKKEMEEVKVIMDKKRAWTTLTTEEQSKLDSFKMNKKWWKWHDRKWFEGKWREFK